MKSHRVLTASILTASLFAFSAGASAAGSSSMPSASAPRYDPVEDYRKGVAALQASQFDDARRAFDRVLDAAPRDANANYLAGLARVGTNDLKGARRYFEKAVKFDGAMIPARQQLGVTLARLGKIKQAQEELDALAARATACADTCPEAADLRAATAAIATAISQAPQARIHTTPGPVFTDAAAGDIRYQEAVSLINERRYQEAIYALINAQAVFGPHPDILTWLGFANRQLGRTELAESYYRKALAAAPDHKGATEYFGELLVARGDLANARIMLARLDALCTFGCAEAEELRRWIAKGHARPH